MIILYGILTLVNKKKAVWLSNLQRVLNKQQWNEQVRQWGALGMAPSIHLYLARWLDRSPYLSSFSCFIYKDIYYTAT